MEPALPSAEGVVEISVFEMRAKGVVLGIPQLELIEAFATSLPKLTLPPTKASHFTFLAISGEAGLHTCLDISANKP